MVMKKDETSRRASWSGIAEQLEYWIESGRLQAGQRLPSEESLAKELGCHRDTLRTAIRCLAGEGKLTRRKGSGFTVAMPRFRRNLYDFEPLWYFLQQNRRQFTSRVISMERLKPVPRVARLLKLNEAGEAYRLCRCVFWMARRPFWKPHIYLRCGYGIWNGLIWLRTACLRLWLQSMGFMQIPVTRR